MKRKTVGKGPEESTLGYGGVPVIGMTFGGVHGHENMEKWKSGGHRFPSSPVVLYTEAVNWYGFRGPMVTGRPVYRCGGGEWQSTRNVEHA